MTIDRLDLSGWWDLSLDPCESASDAHFDDMISLPGTLDENGLGDVPVRCVPIFVNTAAQLHIPAAVEYYTAKSFYAALEEGALLPETNCDPAALVALLQKNLKQG